MHIYRLLQLVCAHFCLAFWALVNAEGFEPSTACLEGRCSIQLSYASIISIPSGWQDSNLRPPAPKAGAITGLRYTPKKKAERQGLEPWRRLLVDRLAICSVTTPAPLLNKFVRTYPFLRLQM